jgi:Icc-related predicted phosphoesterase
MRIVHISDTHSRHRLLHDLPSANVIVHSGDVSWAGKPEEVMDFIEWFGGLNFGHIHDAYGIDKIHATTFANAALLNEAYQLTNEPIVFNA